MGIHRPRSLLLIVLTLALVMSSCTLAGEADATDPTPASTLEFEDNIVSALGEAVPEKWANLAFPSGGYELKLLVKPGEAVMNGELLAWVNDLAQQAALENAQAALASAQANLERLEDLEAGDLELDAARKSVSAAEAGLALAEENLRNTELRAPFSGMVVDTYLRQGEVAGPGQVVVLLADLSSLLIETTDLSEVDVARVRIGDPARVVFDALPGVTATGEVVRIAQLPEQGAGVYYTVTIRLEEIPAELRWGMSAFIEVEVSH